MKYSFPLILCVFCYLLPFSSIAGNDLDSLEKFLMGSGEAPLHNTIKVDILIDLSIKIWGDNPEKALEYGKQALVLAKQLNRDREIANKFHSI
ncbi:MAG: hypothetical protein ABII90_05835 [Bacteroidota bacterium]